MVSDAYTFRETISVLRLCYVSFFLYKIDVAHPYFHSSSIIYPFIHIQTSRGLI